MTKPAIGTATDPLGAFVAAHIAHQGSRPIPLVSTHYDISINGGFAVVESRRVFRNSEDASIEATLTFPLPVDAVLFSLEAENDGRKLKAKAQRREEAREVYESAIDAGKAAVLHEELLRGIHMISVAHIAPGTEIAVTTRWATTLSWIGQRWTLRIPLTVGHVYGHSPLSDADALESGGANGVAEVAIRSASGRVSLARADLADGRAQVPLNRPIDIEVSGADASPLNGVGADGRAITLEIAPLPNGRDTLDLAILVDRSGSMGELCGHKEPNATKLYAVIAGLKAFAPHLRKGDAAEVWEFDDAVTRVGSTRDERPHWRIARHDWRPDAMFEQLLRGLRGPGGGTELGGALTRVLDSSPARDVLLITDGKSYALDVQRLARYGRRIAVVLVGEDSLDANVGHLAGLTGGCVFVAVDDDIASAVAAAAASLRSCPLAGDAIEGQPQTVEVVRGGAVVKAAWGERAAAAVDERIGAGIAAFAAGLALARMAEAAAAEYAEREGLCSHLTSLVLIDEAAAAQDGIPALRKVALPAPLIEGNVMYAIDAYHSEGMHSGFAPQSDALRELIRPPARKMLSIDVAATAIDWDVAPAQLMDGDLSSLDDALSERLRELADVSEVQLWAAELGVDPIVLIIATLAFADRHGSRTAARIARKILGATPPVWIEELAQLVPALA